MEWTGTQQILFLLQSAGMGMGIGLLFDGMTALGRFSRRRVVAFVLDALFGVVAALVTFYGSLMITDGKMHPLLFIGGVLGFWAEHASVGVLFSRGVYGALRFLARYGGRVLDVGEKGLLTVPAFLVSVLPRRGAEKKTAKKAKKINIFSKKT